MDATFTQVIEGADNDSKRRSPDSIFGLWTARLSRGDAIDLATLEVTPAPFKTPLSDREVSTPAETSNDIFANDSMDFDRIAASLFKSTAASTFGVTAQKYPQFRVEMNKRWEDAFAALALDAGAKGMLVGSPLGEVARGFDGTDPATGIYSTSYVGMWMNLLPTA